MLTRVVYKHVGQLLSFDPHCHFIINIKHPILTFFIPLFLLQGGNGLLKGLPARLEAELSALLSQRLGPKARPVPVRVSVHPRLARHAVWLGGSVLGASDGEVIGVRVFLLEEILNQVSSLEKACAWYVSKLSVAAAVAQ